MDAEKALALIEELCPSVLYDDDGTRYHSPDCTWPGHAAARTLARAAFEERGHAKNCGCNDGVGSSYKCSTCGAWHVADDKTPRLDPRCALPKWLTETSR